MGVPNLKIKQELHYRRGYTHASCGSCNHYVAAFEPKSCNGLPLGKTEPRCLVIGLENSRRYRVHPANICDRFDGSESLARVKGNYDKRHGNLA